MPAKTPIQNSPFSQQANILKDPVAPTVPNLHGPGANGQTGGPGVGGSTVPPALASQSGPTGPPMSNMLEGMGSTSSMVPSGGVTPPAMNMIEPLSMTPPAAMTWGGGGDAVQVPPANMTNSGGAVNFPDPISNTGTGDPYYDLLMQQNATHIGELGNRPAGQITTFDGGGYQFDGAYNANAQSTPGLYDQPVTTTASHPSTTLAGGGRGMAPSNPQPTQHGPGLTDALGQIGTVGDWQNQQGYAPEPQWQNPSNLHGLPGGVAPGTQGQYDLTQEMGGYNAGGINYGGGGYQDIGATINANNNIANPNNQPGGDFGMGGNHPASNYARGTGVPAEEFIQQSDGSWIPDPNRWEQVNGKWQLRPGIIGRGTGNNANDFNPNQAGVNPGTGGGGGGAEAWGGGGGGQNVGGAATGNAVNVYNLDRDPVGQRGERQEQARSESASQSGQESHSGSQSSSSSQNQSGSQSTSRNEGQSTSSSQQQSGSQSTSRNEGQSTSSSQQESGSQSQSQNQSQSQSRNESQATTNVLQSFGVDQARNVLGGELGATQRPDSAYTRDMFEQRSNELDALIARQAQERSDQLMNRLGGRGGDTRSLGAASVLDDILRDRYAQQISNRRQMELDWAGTQDPFNLRQRELDVAERGQDAQQNEIVGRIIGDLLGQRESQSTSFGTSDASSFGTSDASSFGLGSSQSQSSNLGTSDSSSFGLGSSQSQASNLGTSDASSFGLGSSQSQSTSFADSIAQAISNSLYQQLGQGWNESYFIPQSTTGEYIQPPHPDWLGLI